MVFKVQTAYRSLLIFAIILTGFFLVFSSANAALVTCGRTGQPLCTTCDLLGTASNIINFVFFTLVPAIAVLFYLIAGFLILLGGANPSLVGTGRTMFKNTTWGLIIIFSAWMITNSVLKSIAGNSLFTKDWNKVVCAVKPVASAPPTPVQRYACGSVGCVPSSGGQYTEPTCNNTCASAPAGGTCSGAACSDSSLNICGSTPTNCSNASVNRWDQQVSAAIATAGQICSGVDTAKLIKAIMANESGGVPRTASDGESAGLMQMKPATAENYKTQCGVSAGTVINFAWLNNPDNGQAQICMAIAYIKDKLVGQCGCDVRQLAAGYNGGDFGACAQSTNCGSAAAAQGGQCSACSGEQFTRRWECSWDNNEHTVCNVDRGAGSLSVTRAYVPKVNYCYGQF